MYACVESIRTTITDRPGARLVGGGSAFWSDNPRPEHDTSPVPGLLVSRCAGVASAGWLVEMTCPRRPFPTDGVELIAVIIVNCLVEFASTNIAGVAKWRLA